MGWSLLWKRTLGLAAGANHKCAKLLCIAQCPVQSEVLTNWSAQLVAGDSQAKQGTSKGAVVKAGEVAFLQKKVPSCVENTHFSFAA
eukprot:626864-Pelagomonas_calceolata.AAC.5